MGTFCAPSSFLSTPSARRATFLFAPSLTAFSDFYPRPPRGGRPFFNGFGIPGYLISIHALREEGDTLDGGMVAVRLIFLSTPSARRATDTHSGLGQRGTYFYPRPPRGGRRKKGDKLCWISYFYPRPPRGGRRVLPATAARAAYFYPRPPRGGRPQLLLTEPHD